MRPMIGIAFFSLLTISGCDALVSGAGTTLMGNGVTTEQKRQLAAFEEVDISESFEATITLGSAPSVTLQVDENLVNLVRTSVNGGVLSVTYVDGPIIVTNKPQKIAIVVPSLSRIVARGASKITSGVVEKKHFTIESEGAASVEVKGLDCDQVDVKVSGAGRVSIEGKGKSLTLDASGASRLKGQDTLFDSARVSMSGATRCEVNVTRSIDGELSGASLLTVEGGPTDRSIKVLGAARVAY